jgi:dephospho-CoA kinase
MIVIGITGTLGAGKGTIVERLIEKGFKHYSARAYFLDEVRKRGLPENRDNTTNVANDLREKFGPDFIAVELYKQAQEYGGNSVIESQRTVGEVEYLKSKGNYYLFAIDADVHARYERIIARKSSLDFVTFEKFVENEEREMRSTDPTKGNISACMKLADYSFQNNGTKEELFAKVDEVIEKILTK